MNKILNEGRNDQCLLKETTKKHHRVFNKTILRENKNLWNWKQVWQVLLNVSSVGCGKSQGQGEKAG